MPGSSSTEQKKAGSDKEPVKYELIDSEGVFSEMYLRDVTIENRIKEVAESRMLKKLSAEPAHIDEICRASNLPAAAVSSTLAMMELKGMVKQVGTMNYCLCREAREKYTVEID